MSTILVLFAFVFFTAASQGLAAATEQEFKRLKKTPGIENGTHEAAPEGVETETPVAANLDFLFEKKRNPVLGPAKISAAESRGQRPYQVRSLGV